MATKLRITSRTAGTVRHAGAVVRSVDSDIVAKALGAEEVVFIPRANPRRRSVRKGTAPR